MSENEKMTVEKKAWMICVYHGPFGLPSEPSVFVHDLKT